MRSCRDARKTPAPFHCMLGLLTDLDQCPDNCKMYERKKKYNRGKSIERYNGYIKRPHGGCPDWQKAYDKEMERVAKFFKDKDIQQ